MKAKYWSKKSKHYKQVPRRKGGKKEDSCSTFADTTLPLNQLDDKRDMSPRSKPRFGSILYKKKNKVKPTDSQKYLLSDVSDRTFNKTIEQGSDDQLQKILQDLSLDEDEYNRKVNGTYCTDIGCMFPPSALSKSVFDCLSPDTSENENHEVSRSDLDCNTTKVLKKQETKIDLTTTTTPTGSYDKTTTTSDSSIFLSLRKEKKKVKRRTSQRAELATDRQVWFGQNYVLTSHGEMMCEVEVVPNSEDSLSSCTLDPVFRQALLMPPPPPTRLSSKPLRQKKNFVEEGPLEGIAMPAIRFADEVIIDMSNSLNGVYGSVKEWLGTCYECK